MADIFNRLFGRKRRKSKLRLPDLHLPEVHMPGLHMPDLRLPEFKSFETWDRQGRGDRAGALLIPAVLALAGGGVAFIWWRQWARGGAEGDIAVEPEIAAEADAPGEIDQAVEPVAEPKRTKAARSKADADL